MITETESMENLSNSSEQKLKHYILDSLQLLLMNIIYFHLRKNSEAPKRGK